MTKAQLQRRLSYLESQHDQLEIELQSLDTLMRMIGFGGGLATVKATAREIIDKGCLEGNHCDESENEREAG